MAHAEDETSAGSEAGRPQRWSFRDYFLGTIVRPHDSFDALMTDPRRLRFGIIALVATSQLYMLVYIVLSLGGSEPAGFKPWLDLPVASYFRYGEFLAVPSMFAGWLVAAGLAQLLTRAVAGRGSFEDTLGVLGLAISVASLPVLLIDLPQSVLGAFGVIEWKRLQAALSSPGLWHELVMLLYSLSITWSAVLFCVAVRSTQRVGRGVAVLTGLLSYLAYAAVFVLFNR